MKYLLLVFLISFLAVNAGADSSVLKVTPKYVTIVVFKDRKSLEVYGGDSPEELSFITSYNILGLSGELGPKLKVNDGQVPEGIYKIIGLKPNNSMHRSLRINYPNRTDILRARSSGQTEPLGGDIKIQGQEISEGCVGISNEALDQIFSLAERTKIKRWKVIITPTDFRILTPPQNSEPVYQDILADLQKLPGRGPYCSLDYYPLDHEIKRNFDVIGVLTDNTCDAERLLKESQVKGCQINADAIQFFGSLCTMHILRYRQENLIQ
jgi:hypothetical protein